MRGRLVMIGSRARRSDSAAIIIILSLKGWAKFEKPGLYTVTLGRDGRLLEVEMRARATPTWSCFSTGRNV